MLDLAYFIDVLFTEIILNSALRFLLDHWMAQQSKENSQMRI
jgi:hypothetical protein